MALTPSPYPALAVLCFALAPSLGSCKMTETQPYADNLALVENAVNASMLQPNQAMVRQLWSPDYIQHSPLQPTGLQPILDWVGYMEANGKGDFQYEQRRILADGNLVALHGKVVGLGPEPAVLFNIFRIEDGQLAEHWEGMQALVSPTKSGRTMLDGPTEPADLHLTAANKTLVTEFVSRVLVKGEFDAIGEYFDGDTYRQHNPMIPDGLSGLNQALAAMAEQGVTMRYTKLHRLVGMGNFVLTHSEGTFGGSPYQYFDLFRIENGKIAEDWDCMQDISGGSKNNNGIF